MHKSTTPHKAKINDKSFLFLASEELLDSARSIAASNEMSLASFIRQALRQSINRYETLK